MIRLIVVLFTALVLLAGLEFLIGRTSDDLTIQMPRLFQAHPGGFVWHRPGVHTKMITPETVNWSLTYNSTGMRDRERSLAKIRRRVVVLGDSYVEGLQLPDDKTVTRDLEKLLGDSWEVLNFGITGAGTTESLLIYNHLAKSYSPDIVALFFYVGNDVRNNSPTLEGLRNNLVEEQQRRLRPYLIHEADRGFALSLRSMNSLPPLGMSQFVSRWLLAHSVVYRYIHDHFAGLEVKNCPIKPIASEISKTLPYGGRNVSAGVFLGETPPVWQQAWAATFEALNRLNQAVTSSGARLVLVAIPYATDLVEATVDMKLRYAYDIQGDCQKHFLTNDLNYQVSYPKTLQPVDLPASFDFDLPTRKLMDYSASVGIEFIDLTALYRRRATQFKDFWQGDRHWTESGAQAAAEALAQRFRAEPIE